MDNHYPVTRRLLLLLVLVLGLAAVTSCSAGETAFGAQVESPTDGGTPPDTSGVLPPDTTGAVPPDTSAVPPDTSGAMPAGGPVSPGDGLLACQLQKYAKTTQVVGPAGGQINVGSHNLKIFEGALSENVTITAEQVEGETTSVRFSPEGLHFAVPAVLTLSYKNCSNVRHSKRLAYTDESLNILEWPLSLDFSRSSQVKGLINHFSRYAIAY